MSVHTTSLPTAAPQFRRVAATLRSNLRIRTALLAARWAVPFAVATLAATGALAQIAPGDFQVGSPLYFGPSGNGVLSSPSAQTVTRTADSAVYNLPTEVQFNSNYNLDFRLSPSQQFLYVTKSNPSGGLTTVCGGFPNQQILMYELGSSSSPIPFVSTTGPACIQGPLTQQPRFFDELGLIRTMFLVGDTDSGSGQKHAVLWADLVGRQMAINSNTFNNGTDAIQFSPSGNAAFIIHGRSTIQTVYNIVDLCANPLGGAIGAPQNLPSGSPGATVTDLGSGLYDASLLINGSVQPGSQVSLSTTCYGGGIACCTPFGNCDDSITAEECTNMGGSPLPGDCSTAECVEACCQPDGSCSLTDFASCGNPQGAMTCDAISCPIPTEACCSFDGFCSDRPPADCLNLGNTPAGPGSECATESCPILAVDLVVSGPSSVEAGSDFTYTIDYANVGDLPAVNAVLTDSLPFGLRFVSATGGGFESSFNNVTWNLDTIATSGPSSSGQLSLTVNAQCSGSFANNSVQLTSTTESWFQNSNFVSTQIVEPSSEPLPVLISSTPLNGLPVEGSDLISHRITLQNTLSTPRNGIRVPFASGNGMTFESVSDAAGGTVVMYDSTQWEWNGDLPPNSSTHFVITTRVAACINADDVGIENLFAYNGCNDLIANTAGPRIAVRRAVDVNTTATNLSAPTIIETYQSRTRYQIMRRGGSIEALLTVGNPHAGQRTVSAGLTLPFGFDPVGASPLLAPIDPGASWDAGTRRIDWSGTLAGGQEVQIRFAAVHTGTNLSAGFFASGSDGSCSILDNQALAVIPPTPPNPHLAGAFESSVWTLQPGIDSAPQPIFNFPSVFVDETGVGKDGDIWVMAFPIFRINPVRLELQGFPQSFMDDRLGFTPRSIAIDPSDGSALFGGAIIGEFNQEFAKLVRYDPVTDQVTPVFEESVSSIRAINSIAVEANGMLGIVGSNRRLYRIDPLAGTATALSDTGLVSNYGPVELDEDGSFLSLRDSFSGPIPLVDVDPASGVHDIITSDLLSFFPSSQFGFSEVISGENEDLYVRYRFNGLGRLQRQPSLSAQELIPYSTSGQDAVGMGWISPGPCVDGDGDGVPSGSGCGAGADCNDSDASIYPGATEINDGLDNQCPGDPGSGVVDEISGWVEATAGDFCWPAQAGATQYEIVRSSDPTFATSCTRSVLTGTCWMEAATPPANGMFYYLTRVLSPNVGSFGADSAGVERIPACP